MSRFGYPQGRRCPRKPLPGQKRFQMKSRQYTVVFALVLAVGKARAEPAAYERDLQVEVWADGQQNRDRYDGSLDRAVSIPVHPFLTGKGWTCTRRALTVTDTSFGTQIDCWNTDAGTGASIGIECNANAPDKNTSVMTISTGGTGYVNAVQWFRLGCSNKRLVAAPPSAKAPKKG